MNEITIRLGEPVEIEGVKIQLLGTGVHSQGGAEPVPNARLVIEKSTKRNRAEPPQAEPA